MGEEALRDALSLFADAMENAVQVLKQALKPESKGAVTWDPERIKWEKAEGVKGVYERADPAATPDFKDMLADLKAHGGRLTREGLFYWVFTDAATVGRKAK